MADLYSYSRLDSFKQCPRLYAYRYVEKPDVEKLTTIEAFLGTVCHETVQQIYKDLRLSKLLTLDETLALYEDRWAKKPPVLRIVRERYDEENYHQTGRRFVTDFYERKKPFDDGRTIGIEKQVQLKLAPDVELVGYIDRLVDHGGGHYEIIDYKTQADIPSAQDLEKNWQLPLYHLALKQMFPDLKEATLTWDYLAHNKSISIRRTPESLERLKTEVLELVARIGATSEFEPRVSALCSWCDYQSICPARKHLVAVEDLPAAELKKESGVELVDQYMKAKQSVSESQTRLAALEKRIIDYAAKNNYRVLRGTDDKLTVWQKKGATQLVPKETHPKASAAVTAILMKHKLYEKYSYLSGFSLVKALEAGELPVAVIEELQPYLYRTDVVRLYASKLREWA